MLASRKVLSGQRPRLCWWLSREWKLALANCSKAMHSFKMTHSAQISTAGQARKLVQVRAVHPEVKMIASDVDGTLLNSKQQLSAAVEMAVKRAADAGVPLFVATGKARGPWVEDVFPRLPMKMPGVFLQGLLIYDAEGNRIYERELEHDVALDVIKLAREQGVTLTAYCGERILAASIDKHTERLAFYREPTVEAVGPLDAVVGKVSMQKMIFMAEQGEIERIRPLAEQLLHGRASLTTALEGMLEVLPLGSSKGAGVTWLLEHLGVDPANVMAMGDGENDLEMLQLAGLGVAMGNAGPKVKAAADVVVATNDEDGVAEAINKYVLATVPALAASS